MPLSGAPLGKAQVEGFLEAMAYGPVRQRPSCPVCCQVNREVDDALYCVIKAACRLSFAFRSRWVLDRSCAL